MLQDNHVYTELFKRAKAASKSIALLPEKRRDEILLAVADAILPASGTLLSANALDLERMAPENPLYDRLRLTRDRLEGIAADTRHVATLASPVGEEIENRVLPNGLRLRRVRVPFGVVVLSFAK